MSEIVSNDDLPDGPGNSRTDEWFRLRDAPKLSVRAIGRSRLGVTEIRYTGKNFGVTEQVAAEDAFLVALGLVPSSHIEVWHGGKSVSLRDVGPGESMLFDLKSVTSARFVDPVHLLQFYLPRSFLNELSDDLEAPRRIDELPVKPNNVGLDSVVLRLGNAVRPALEAPHEANDLFASQIMLAFGTYICARSGALQTPRVRPGGLTALQERNAKALIDAHIDGNISLQYLATACGLSPTHLAHAFRASVGVAPHRWLLQRRVDRAKQMLQQGGKSTAEIALECGFADQSHLTRVFRRLTGHTPSAWRHAQ